MGDIAFLLLVFYMATTMVTDQKPREVPLPEVEAGVKSSPYPLIIYVDRKLGESRQAFFFNKVISFDRLGETVQEQASTAPAAVRVYLNIERDLPFRVMNGVIEALKKAGIKNLIITTTPPKPEGGMPGVEN